MEQLKAPANASWAYRVAIETTPHYDSFIREMKKRIEAVTTFLVPAEDAAANDILDGDPTNNLVITHR